MGSDINNGSGGPRTLIQECPMIGHVDRLMKYNQMGIDAERQTARAVESQSRALDSVAKALGDLGSETRELRTTFRLNTYAIIGLIVLLLVCILSLTKTEFAGYGITIKGREAVVRPAGPQSPLSGSLPARP